MCKGALCNYHTQTLQSYSALYYAWGHKARHVIHQRGFETDRGLCTESRGQLVHSYRVWFFCHDEQAAIQTWMAGECFCCINRLWPLTAWAQISAHPHTLRRPIRYTQTHLHTIIFHTIFQWLLHCVINEIYCQCLPLPVNLKFHFPSIIQQKRHCSWTLSSASHSGYVCRA